MKKVTGYLILLFVVGFLFIGVAKKMGVYEAIVIWGIAGVCTALIVLSITWIVEDNG